MNYRAVSLLKPDMRIWNQDVLHDTLQVSNNGETYYSSILCLSTHVFDARKAKFIPFILRIDLRLRCAHYDNPLFPQKKKIFDYLFEPHRDAE